MSGRIAIARAFVTGGPILVLDEPTSALEHEHLITETLASLTTVTWLTGVIAPLR